MNATFRHRREWSFNNLQWVVACKDWTRQNRTRASLTSHGVHTENIAWSVPLSGHVWLVMRLHIAHECSSVSIDFPSLGAPIVWDKSFGSLDDYFVFQKRNISS